MSSVEDPPDRVTAGDPMGDQGLTRVKNRYRIIGFISSGTYGRVYKASRQPEQNDGSLYAIKKFKPDKEGERPAYTGISQSTIREMSLCSELNNTNIIKLVETILEDKSIFMAFEYAEHDLLQIIHYHGQQPRQPIPPPMIKSIIFQLINGCRYLHTNWVLHRDLKPANIMVTSSGVVKIGDFGLARRFNNPLRPLFVGDNVVVTIWYRAPELLLGTWHYTAAIDMWAVGCIFAELLCLHPIFKGEEVKPTAKRVPFQHSQMQKIANILGNPTHDQWSLITSLPHYGRLLSLQPPAGHFSHTQNQHTHDPSSTHSTYRSYLEKWYHSRTQTDAKDAASFHSSLGSESLPRLGSEGYNLLASLLQYDPEKRLTAGEALEHPVFCNGSKVSMNCFEGLTLDYPHRRVSRDDNDM